MRIHDFALWNHGGNLEDSVDKLHRKFKKWTVEWIKNSLLVHIQGVFLHIINHYNNRVGL